ncbi:MAG: hypothetical protein ACOYBT_10420, partial [Polynucleobacter sp.]
MLNPTGAGGVYVEPGNLTGGGGVGWHALNFNGFFNTSDVLVNRARGRWRIGADQRSVNERFFIDQVSNTGVSNTYITCIAGNLGVQQGNPQAALDVTGNVRVQGNLVAQTASLGSLFCSNIIGLAAAANVVDIAGNSFNYTSANLGSLSANTLSVLANTRLQGNVFLANASTIAFGYDQVKDYFAGQLGYKAFSSSFDIVGAGTTGSTRAVRVWDQLGIGNNPTSPYVLDISGISRFGGGLSIQQQQTINLGYDAAGKEANAGRIGYNAFTTGGSAVDVVGGGTAGNRSLKVYDNLGIGLATSATPAYTLDVGGTARMQGSLIVGNSVAGNVCNVQLLGATAGNVTTLGANIIYCSNFPNLVIPPQQSLQDISGNSVTYNAATFSKQVTANVCNLQLLGATAGNIVTLGANVIYCSNFPNLVIPPQQSL